MMGKAKGDPPERGMSLNIFKGWVLKEDVNGYGSPHKMVRRMKLNPVYSVNMGGIRDLEFRGYKIFGEWGIQPSLNLGT